MTVIEVTVGGTPEPDKLIVVGELVALLVTVTAPETPPVPDGANVTFKTVFCPGPRMIPDAPVALKPGPETLTLEMVALELPELVKVVLKVLLVPMVTLPKVKLEGFTVNCAEPELTVSVAALLVVLPTELLTVTTTCAPLSEAVVTGIV